ncbi:MAG: DUF1585 domain-containing protein [Myxococcota bacterium]
MTLDWKRLLLAAALVPGCSAEGTAMGTDGDEAGSDGGSDDGESETDTEDAEVEYLEPADHLVRISMALRGVRPSPDELDRVAAAPEVIADIVEEYLVDPRFGETIRELHNDALLVGTEVQFPQLPPFEDVGSFTLGHSVMQGPLRLAEYVVMEDRPYTELVTADYAIVDELAASIQALPYDPGGPELQTTEWTDRPAAGVLSDAALYVRHRSNGANYHRGRANAVSKAFLCHDFLAADVEIDGSVDLSDPEAVNEAVTNNPACVACHQSLDPLASFFWGYPGNANPNQIPAYPVTQLYDAGSVDRWQTTTGQAPALFGKPADDMAGLGQLIADDARFSSCAARRFYAFFHQVDLSEVPSEHISTLQAALVDSGFDAKAIVREIMLSDEFRVSHALEDEPAETLVGFKKARPSQLARLFDDLTGFRWQTNVDALVNNFNEGDIDLMRTNTLGFAVLAGGTDAFFVERPSSTVNTTSSLLVRTFAAEAASYVVEHDLVESPEQARLLTLVDIGNDDESTIREQLVSLSRRIYSDELATDDEAIDDAWALWSAAYQGSDDSVHAWKTTLTAMLQDLRIVYY